MTKLTLSLLLALFVTCGFANSYPQPTSEKIYIAPTDFLRQSRFDGKALAWSPDGHTLAVSIGGSLYLYDANAIQVPPILLDRTALTVGPVVYNHDGSLLAVAHGGALDLWNVSTRTRLATLKARSGAGPVLSIYFTPDNRQVYVGMWSGALEIVNIENIQETPSISIIDTTLGGVQAISATKVILQGESLRLAEIDRQTNSLKPIAILNEPYLFTSSIVFSPSGNLAAVGGDDGGTYIWDAMTGKTLATIWPGVPASSVAFSPDEHYLATGVSALFASGENPFSTATNGEATQAFSEEEDLIGIWPIQEAVQKGTLDLDNASLVLQGHTDEIVGVAFSPDGLSLASMSLDGTLRTWDLQTGQEIAQTELVS